MQTPPPWTADVIYERPLLLLFFIGQRLALKGARKIYGLDISSQMIEDAQKNLKDLGMADKFELICQDIFDESFNLPEKVDCVVLSYTLTTFISNYEMLVKIIKRCSEQVTLGFLFNSFSSSSCTDTKAM